MQYLLPFFGVILGALIALAVDNHRSSAIKLLLSFSGAFLLALSLFVLLPDIYEHITAKTTGLLIMLGILLQIFLEFFSGGAEHGHVHMNNNNEGLPILLFASLGLHSFLEGFPIHTHETMVYGILIHKIPIALLITSFLIKSESSKWFIAAFVLVFAVLTPLGTWCSSVLPLGQQVIYNINALIVGVFLHISTTIIFESGDGHKFNLSKLISIVAGIAVAYLL